MTIQHILCRQLIHRLGDPPVQHSYREANQAADVLGRKVALSTYYDDIMEGKVPPLFMDRALDVDKKATTFAMPKRPTHIGSSSNSTMLYVLALLLLLLLCLVIMLLVLLVLLLLIYLIVRSWALLPLYVLMNKGVQKLTGSRLYRTLERPYTQRIYNEKNKK